MKKTIKGILGVLLSISIIMTTVSSASAANAEESQGTKLEKILDVVEQICSRHEVLRMQEKRIQEQVHTLNQYGIPLEYLSNMSVEKEAIIYELQLTDEIVNTVSVANNDGDVVLDIREDDIHNVLVYKTDGTILLNNNVVEITMEDNFVEHSREGTTRTGGFNWYAEENAPSYLLNASYGSYTNTANVPNVSLNIALENITLATIVSILTSSSTVAGAFISFGIASLNELRRYNATSEKISHKIYTAKSSTSPRYLKRRVYVYPNANYQGGYNVTYTYGVLI